MILLSPKETAARLGISEFRCRAAIKAGQIPAQRFGRNYMVAVAFLEALEKEMASGGVLAGLPNGQRKAD